MKPHPQIIAWDDKLATGLTDVDSQHQHLFDLTNQLGALHASGATVEQITEILNELKRYTVEHFVTEEALMHSQPVSEAHRNAHFRAHQGFVKHIERTGALVASDPGVTVELLLSFLAQWLLHHVANMDQLLSAEILALSSGATPEQFAARRENYKDNLVENINAVYRDLGDRTFQMLEINLQLQSEIDRRKRVEQELGESKARFRTMADHTHSWEYWQGIDGKIIYMSPSCERITGYTAGEFAADPGLLYRVIHPDDRHLMEEHKHDIATEEDGEEEVGFRVVRRDGEIRWIIHTCKALYDPSVDFIGRRSSNRDITDRKTQNDSMLLVATVFESVNEAVLLTNPDNQIVMVNTSFTHITGYTPEELIGLDPGVLADVVPDPEVVKAQWKKLTAKGRWQGEMINRRKNGELYTAWVSIDSVRDDMGEVGNFILVFSDISERKESERRIHYLAHYDQLTGLPNWTLFSDRMQQAILTAKRNETFAALMFVDIDHFKQAKDQIGYDLGDMLLKQVANRIQGCLRQSDTAARIGSDEFVVLLPEIELAQDAVIVAEKILCVMTEPFVLDDHMLQISASIGIALFPDHGESIGQIMKNADLAMYQAKQVGGAVVMIYSPVDWARR